MRDDDTIHGDGWTADSRDPSKVGIALMVVYRDGIQVIPLQKDVPVTLGRNSPADIQVHSRRLSRVHCRFLWDGKQVLVEDLKSTNGTWLNGAKIDRSKFDASDEVTVGSVVVTQHAMGSLPMGLAGVERHEQFLKSVDGEISRARTFGRGLAVLQLRSFGGRGMLARWVPRIQESLRVVDRIGLFSPNAIEVVLAEADAADALRSARSLVQHRGDGEPPLVAGVAVYPQHGSSAQALVSAANEAVGGASLVESVVLYRQDGDSLSIDDEGGPVVRNPRMVELWRTLDRLASASISVLIVGETGVGKEIIARGIHERSPRASGPMKAINCGAIPATLLESVLFGHERGAFTGADRQRSGVFEEGSGGTVLLDEIGELSLQAQVALLRVLEERKVTRVGGSQAIPVDVRVLAATHRDLEAMCRAGGFRWDLYYRLNTMTLAVPPLRERADEVRALVRRFVEDANRLNGRDIIGVSPRALRRLEDYRWPGNVRELRNVVERAVVIATGEYITVDDLPVSVRGSEARALEPDEPLEEDVTDVGAPDRVRAPVLVPLKQAVGKLERHLICAGLAACEGNQSRAAEILGLSRRTLVYKLKALDIGDRWQGSDPLLPMFDVAGQRMDFAARIRAFELERVHHALELTGGDRAEAARLLGIQKRTLDRKLDK